MPASNTQIKNVLSMALKSIKPKVPGIPQAVRTVLSNINILLKKKKIKARAVLGGSFAKGVYLATDFDVDIFVQFNRKEYSGNNISALLATAIKPLKPIQVHGSRDYFQFSKGNIQFEIVPVLEITTPSQAVNVTDCSPLHVAWVRKHINKLHDDIRDDIRLAKQFLKACGAYGAESYIRGFSGHVIDLLVIMHKGFIPLLSKAAGWKPPVVIDFSNAHKGKALQRLNPAKIQSPLIIVDPVQPERNASASLSIEKFSLFLNSAARFLEKPDPSFFEIHPPDIKKLRKKGLLITITSWPKAGKRDVAGSKLLQTHELILKEIEPFGIVDSGWYWQPPKPALLYYILKQTLLPQTITIAGPPVHLKIHAEAFQKKHPTALPEKNRLVAIEARKERTITQVLARILSSDYIHTRVKRITPHEFKDV